MIRLLESLGVAIVLCSGVIIAALLKVSAVVAPSPDYSAAQTIWNEHSAKVAHRRAS
jgi:hypothetical protein